MAPMVPEIFWSPRKERGRKEKQQGGKKEGEKEKERGKERKRREKKGEI